ncbi:MAG TPA: fatty acid--CoA ligase family protein [Dongiaceae bacterium]
MTKLGEHAAKRERHPAIVTAARTLTYGDLFHSVTTSMSALKDLGFTASDVIGVSLDDEVEHLIVSLAIMGLGATHITFATHDPPQVHASTAKRAVVNKTVSTQEAAKILDHGSGPGALAALHPAGAGTGAALYLKTSGTTGDMNIVPFSEDQIADQALRHADYEGERLLRLASIEHNNSKRHRLYCILAGGTNVFRPKGSFDLVDFVLARNVTCLDISRMHASDIATLDGADRLSDVKVRTGGSAVPYAVRRRIEQNVTRELYVRYAATECGAISMARPGEHDEAETVGVPLSDVELEIVGPNGMPLKRGESGQIRLRAAGVATGYLNSPEDSAKRFKDGWFYPGDMGCMREDGRLVIQGRSDDMIVLNGLNIFPAEIERVLESHPDVTCAAALALPSRVHGQIPVAAVELKSGATISIGELQLFAREALGLKAPRRILALDRLPRNAQGKIVRKQILPLFKFGEPEGETIRQGHER